MAILKNYLDKDFTTIPNYIILSDISGNAFRLLVYLWSKPHNWNVRQNNIASDFGVHVNSVGKWIQELKKRKYLVVKKQSNGASFEYIYELISEPQNIVCRDKMGISDTHVECVADTHPTHTSATGSKSVVLNKTDNNKTNSNNICADKSARDEAEYYVIIKHLNQLSGSNFKANTNATKKLIKARYNEGFTTNDFITVINYKVNEWLDDELMSKYLRPSTLFGNKFDTYLNEATKNKTKLKNKTTTAFKEYDPNDYD